MVPDVAGSAETAPTRASDGLTIRVSAGSGEGLTRLAAFDAALRDAGVADHNLIRLSSVIPPGSQVEVVSADQQIVGGFGDRLFCVYAAEWAVDSGTEVWAGVAWSGRDDGSGAGLFVEHGAHSEQDLRRQLRLSLDDMDAGRGGGFSYRDQVVARARCEVSPVCAVVIATYRAEDWA